MATYKDTDKSTGETRWRYRFAYKGKRYSGSAPNTIRICPTGNGRGPSCYQKSANVTARTTSSSLAVITVTPSPSPHDSVATSPSTVRAGKAGERLRDPDGT